MAATAAAAALVLLSPHVPSAWASGGTFSYTAPDGKLRISSNPPSNQCLKVNGSGTVKNSTDSDVTLYKTPDCNEANRIDSVDSMSEKDDVPQFAALVWADPKSSESDDSDSDDSDDSGDSDSSDDDSGDSDSGN